MSKKDKKQDQDAAKNAAEQEEMEPDYEVLEEELEFLKTENEKLQDELANAKDQVLRKVAEFENLRKRTQRERIQLFDDARIDAIKNFLPVYDDIERSLGAIDQKADNPMLKGVELVRNKFRSVLEQYGVERIDQTGVPFDVDMHDALLRQPAPDEKTESDTVLQVLESGYKMGDKIIRHAKVIVSE